MGHHHIFKPSAHLDGCHSYTTVAVCGCGATQASVTERDPSRDPYAMIWFDPDCERCGEILSGADVRTDFRQAGPKGRTSRHSSIAEPQESRS